MQLNQYDRDYKGREEILITSYAIFWTLGCDLFFHSSCTIYAMSPSNNRRETVKTEDLNFLFKYCSVSRYKLFDCTVN